MRREKEREKENLFRSIGDYYAIQRNASRVGFAFSEHWAGCAVPNTKEREKGASINCRSAGSRRSLFLLRTTNLALLPNLLLLLLLHFLSTFDSKTAPRRFSTPFLPPVLHPLRFTRGSPRPWRPLWVFFRDNGGKKKRIEFVSERLLNVA